MTKQEKLDYIFNAIKKAFPKKKLVFCDGSLDAKVIIIGEAPGKDEEIQGRPFVGRGGKLLISTLEALDWQRSDFYISNIVKYRPQDEYGGTLTPTEEEINKFRPAIEKEISVVDPELIVLVGRIAILGLGIEGTMTANHGKIVEKNNRKILVTYHPAAILRNMALEPLFRDDLSKIKDLV